MLELSDGLPVRIEPVGSLPDDNVSTDLPEMTDEEIRSVFETLGLAGLVLPTPAVNKLAEPLLFFPISGDSAPLKTS